MNLTRTLLIEFGGSFSITEGIISIIPLMDPASINAFGSSVGVNTTDNLE